MEKFTPHWKLRVLKSMAGMRRVRMTRVARAGAVGLGFDFDGVLAVLLELRATDFYKSMTSYADHLIWQDVYRPVTPLGQLYLHLTVVEDLPIVSFKEM